MPRAAARTPSDVLRKIALLAELRQRIQRIEERPPAPGPRLPPAPLPRASHAVDLSGGVLTVTTRVGPDERIGSASPADAFVADPRVAAPLCDLASPPAGLLHGMRVLDIETTGLGGMTGTVAFLVGVAGYEPDGTLVVHQLVLADPAREGALLDRVLQLVGTGSLLVSYNGRSFDVPVLETRAVLARRSPRALLRLPHLDLIAMARRLWRRRAGDARLCTLEERILGRRRVDDVPGAAGGGFYDAFLRSGDASDLEPILRHNRDDIVGLAALLGAALRVLEDPGTWAEDAEEILAVGEHRLRLGDEPGALPLLLRALELAVAPETRRRALTQLARLHRRAGRLDAARAAWDRCRREFAPARNSFQVAHMHVSREPFPGPGV